jgi:hypothetical protein
METELKIIEQNAEDTASDLSKDSTNSVEEDLKSLHDHIEDMKKTANLLGHRLDSIQRLLEMEKFELHHLSIKVNPYGKPTSVHKLLNALELKEDGLILGEFLRALNRWLIQEDLVDLNDLEIHLNPLVASAFQKPPGLKKVPYALLLSSLPKMFI